MALYGSESSPNYIVVRTAPTLDSPVLLVIGKAELRNRVTKLISLGYEQLISVKDSVFARVAIVVEKKGRLFSGWVTEEYLVIFACETRIPIWSFVEQDEERSSDKARKRRGDQSKRTISVLFRNIGETLLYFRSSKAGF